MAITSLVKSEYANLTSEEILRSPVSVLNGVTESAEKALSGLQVRLVFDLATSRVFANAYRVATFEAGNPGAWPYGMLPSDVGSPKLQAVEDPSNRALFDIEELDGVGSSNAPPLRTALGTHTIADLAFWPPFLAARTLAGLEPGTTEPSGDPGVPRELVPRFNEYATEKAFYSVYVIDPLSAESLDDLTAIDLWAPRKIAAEIPWG